MKELRVKVQRLRSEIQAAGVAEDLDLVEDLVAELDQAIDQIHVQHARDDPNAFIEYVFTDKFGHQLKQSKFHRDWQELIAHDEWNPNGVNRAMIIAPRDHGKTTQIPVGRVLWELGRNPNLRIKIACQSDSKAMERLFEITDHMERNERVIKVFPHLRPAQRGDWCVPVDCEVRLADGRKVRIDEIEIGMPVFGWCDRDRKIQIADIEFVSDVILKPCVFVTTESGRRFRASADHRMLSVNQEYKRAGDLEIGDPVALGQRYLESPPGQVNIHPPTGSPGVSAYEARLLGYLVGDGYTATKAGGPWFTNGDVDVLDDFHKCTRAMTWSISEYADRGTYKMIGVVRGHSEANPRKWLDDHDLLGKRSGDKRIPESVRRSSGALAEFLSAYFVCDGCLDESVNRISFTTMSEQLARDVQDALLAIGAGGRLTPDRSSGAWKVSASGWDAVRLADILSPIRCGKLNRLKEWATRYRSSHDEELRRSDLWHESGSGWRGGDWRRRRPGDPKTLRWERVVSVIDIGILPCIDITIAKPVDTFLLDDGFVAHNTKHKIVVHRTLFSKDASIEALGIMSTATGGRCDLLIADDIVDRRNAIQFPQIRETIKHAWKSDWTNLLEPDGRVVYICTLWHTADNSHELMRNPAYAVLAHAINEKLGEMEAYFIAPGEKRNRKEWKEPLWHHWDYDALLARKIEIGSIEFDRAFRNIALSGEIIVVQPKWIRYFETLPPPERLVFFQGFDLAIGKRHQHDYFAAVTVAVDVEELILYVVEFYRARLSFTQQAMAVINGCLKWEPEQQRVESTAYQESLPQYLDELVGKQIDQDGQLVAPGSGAAGVQFVPALPIVRTKPQLDKMARLKAVTPFLERGQILFDPIMDPDSEIFVSGSGNLIAEITQFPLAPKDDLTDGFVHAVNGAARWLAQKYTDDSDGDELGCQVTIVGA